jgi:glycosyltransferase involved in cell wall biosynthesis
MPTINTAITLKDLPPPPPDKIGWPWTEESNPLPLGMFYTLELPRISIVTPSYNQGQFIEETIRSVLLQNYPNLEYIIIDGGSTDNSVEIIRKYERWLNYWVSEPDRGQTDAIQKGFNLITGVVWNWLNSDDLLEPNALQKIGLAYQNNPVATTYSGKLKHFGTITPYVHHNRFCNFTELVCVWEGWPTPQPAIFLASNACQKVNGLNISLNYIMDYELYLRLTTNPNFQAQLIDDIIARGRWHSDTKTVSQSLAFYREILQVFDKFSRQYMSWLPQGWRKSRMRFAYHLALNSARNSVSKQLDFKDFIQISGRFIPYIWNYRFFWACLVKIYLFPYFTHNKKLTNI